MKIRKTRQSNRGVYKYYRADGTVCTLVPGEDGITELDIKRLHALDDSEVYYNNKNARPDRTDEEKEMIEEWKKHYIKEFKEQHGYEPNKSDVNYAAQEKFPRNYNRSIDYDDIDFDKSEVGLLTAETPPESFEWSDEMKEVMTQMTDRQVEVLNLKCVEHLKQKEIAERLGISEVAVSKHFKKAKAIIEQNRDKFKKVFE